MDSIRGVLRVGLWWCFLLCVLPVTANAATRQIVKMPSNEVALSSQSVATKGAGVIQTAISEGEYIAGHTLDRKTPIKVLKRIDYSIPRTITAAKNLLKNNLAQALLSATIAGAVGAVGWVMSDDNTQLQRKVSDGESVPVTTYGWKLPDWCGATLFQSYAAAQACMVSNKQAQVGSYYVITPGRIEVLSASLVRVYIDSKVSHSGVFTKDSGSALALLQGSCVAPAQVINGLCVTGGATYAPLTDADMTLSLDPYISSQTAPWIKQLLKDACSGSLAPQRCFDELQDSRMVSGPASVAGPSTTTTGTYTRPDGTTGTTSSTVNTNYNIVYGPTYFDYTENKTVTNYKDGTKTDESTTSDTPEVTDEKPEEEKDETSPCTQNCDGPAYVDMYKPTTDTKEQKLDSYSSRFKAVPIFAAASNMFTLSVSGGACPVWQYHGSLSLLSVSADMPIDLVFDYHCLPWFVDLGPFIKAIILIGFTYIAFRIGVL